MANSCCLWQQRSLYPKTATFSLRTLRCRTVHSRLVLRCIRTVSVATHRSWQTGNTVAFGRNRLASIFTSQKRFLGYSTLVWPLLGASCVPRHLLSPLRGILASSLHTGNVALAEDTRPKSKGGEQAHGSVLMEMIKSQDQQPKQLTVGARGMYNLEEAPHPPAHQPYHPAPFVGVELLPNPCSSPTN